MSRKRTIYVHGLKFRRNRHGVDLWEKGDGEFDGFFYWPKHGLVPDDDAGKDLREKVRDAFDAAGVYATCSRPYTTCHCEPRF